VASQAEAAGLTVSTREVADRATAARLVDLGTVAAAVAPGEVVWKNSPDARLAPPIDVALAQTAVAERARALGLTSAKSPGCSPPPRRRSRYCTPRRIVARRPSSPWRA
jgi:hypothetical protein